MISRVMPSIFRLLQSGWELDKNMAAAMAHCDVKTAQRVLAHLWLARECHISAWERNRGGPIPTYKLGDARDARRPAPRTSAEIHREARKSELRREQEAAEKRWKRSVGKVVRLGVWGV